MKVDVEACGVLRIGFHFAGNLDGATLDRFTSSTNTASSSEEDTPKS